MYPDAVAVTAADDQRVPVNIWTVTAAAAFTALATGLGAVPFRFFSPNQRRWNGIAAVLMLVASASLLWQGYGLGVGRLAVGTALGVLFIVVFRRLVGDHDDLVLGRLRGADALKALVIVSVMTAHSAAEGVGVGVSYGGSETLGVFVTVLIALHNVPEGLAISAVLVPRGASVRAAAGWSVFSSLPQPLIAPLAFLFVEQFRAVLPAGLGFAAGAMVWMVWSELVPDLRSHGEIGHRTHAH